MSNLTESVTIEFEDIGMFDQDGGFMNIVGMSLSGVLGIVLVLWLINLGTNTVPCLNPLKKDEEDNTSS